MNERLEALADVEAWQEERAHLERALAWAPARILRADLEKNANLLEVLGPRELEQARLPRCVPALGASQLWCGWSDKSSVAPGVARSTLAVIC